MRPIKFRAKSRHEDAWFYGGIFQTGADCLVVKRGNWEPYLMCHIDHNTVGQFTGLYDKNRKEIYEGDILRFGNSPNIVCEVKWNETIAAFCVRFWFEKKLGVRPLGEWAICERSIEIIGNVHDNPELLKGGER